MFHAIRPQVCRRRLLSRGVTDCRWPLIGVLLLAMLVGAMAGDSLAQSHRATAPGNLQSAHRSLEPLPAAIQTVPRDAIAAYFIAGPEDRAVPGTTRSSAAVATLLIDQAYRLGLMSGVDQSLRVWLDALAPVSTLLEHPHAVVLLDITATPRPDGGHRLASLQAAIIAHTRGFNTGLERRIQHLLNVYTNSDESAISTEAMNGNTVFTLRDRRLPDWALLRWGSIGDYYVITIGENAFDRVAATTPATVSHSDPAESLAKDAWFNRAFAQTVHSPKAPN